MTTTAVTMYFAEYLRVHDVRSIQLNVMSSWTVDETINCAIKEWNIKSNIRSSLLVNGYLRTSHQNVLIYDIMQIIIQYHILKLKGNSSSDYKLMLVDDDEDQIEVDYDIAIRKQSKIDELNETHFCCEYIAIKSPEYIFIRIVIIAPINESRIFKMERTNPLNARDLLCLLNNGKKDVHFHPKYFNLCSENKYGTIGYRENVMDLNKKLTLAPRFLTEEDDIAEAFQCKLVKLANECTHYKLRNTEESVLVMEKCIVYRKIADGVSSINISQILDIHLSVENDKNLVIVYKKTSNRWPIQDVYELESSKQCNNIIFKVKYIMKLITFNKEHNI